MIIKSVFDCIAAGANSHSPAEASFGSCAEARAAVVVFPKTAGHVHAALIETLDAPSVRASFCLR